MKVKSLLLAVALAATAVLFLVPQFANAAIGNQGRICYVKNVTRNADGVITQTGNLFVKDLATGIEQQVTNYTLGAGKVILNPMFNADGTKIIFTSNETVSGDNTYKIYYVSADSSSNTGVGILLQGGTGNDYKYAAISPDEKTVAFVWSSASGDSLWTYNRTNGIYTQVFDDSKNGTTIKDVVFVNATTLAFVGTKSGIQNIYTVDLTGPTATMLTNNTTANVQYLGLKSAIRSATAGNMLIYSKRTKSGTLWSPWDVYVTTSLIPFLEQNVTNTTIAGQDEYEPCFYGDDNAGRDVQLSAGSGNMFYSAKVIGSANKIWQANFSTSGSTNTGKTQRTVDDDAAGLPDWGPPIIELTPTVTIDDTEMAFTQGAASDVQIFKAGFSNGALGYATRVQITTSGSGYMQNPSLGAARIVADVGGPTNPTQIIRTNSDGSGRVDFVNLTGSVTKVKSPSITPDGKWVVYVAKDGTTWKIKAKLLTKTAADLSVDVKAAPEQSEAEIEDPVVSPDMGSIVWVENLGGQRTIYKQGVTFDATAGTVSLVGSAQIMGGNTSQVWNDSQPSFSPDGLKIIFVSNRDGTTYIYTMDANTGLGVTRFPVPAGITNPAYPVYNPINDGSIAFVADSGAERHIYTATSAGATTDQFPVGVGATLNGEKFSWAIKRAPGEITATRTLQSRVAAGETLTYTIKIDVDDGKKPVGYTLEEVVPKWTVGTIKVDGTTTTNFYELQDTPVAGLTTLRFVFMNISGVAGDVSDHIITINLTATDSGTKSFSGTINYTMDGADQTANVTGNGSLLVSKPYCPVDIYNDKGERGKPNGIIEDRDLLYAINAWANSLQLPGYGPAWPANPDTHWDGIILAVVEIWASRATTRGYYWKSSGAAPNPAQVAASEASEKVGRYLYIGDRDGDTTVDTYSRSGASSGVPEMYWTQGKWSD
ncbi:MAG: hypothetical protein NC825_05220 [Candidatus Omnitrophica bacterium]|nr:hypothetical protein [Candidatus Omnitrophota bacterium]